MKLPLLTLDMRRKALIAGADHIDVIDDKETVFARAVAVRGNYGHASEMVDRINNYPRVIDALRKLAIIPTMAPGHQNEVVHDGYRCRVCKSTFKIGVHEIHSTDCPLKGSKP